MHGRRKCRIKRIEYQSVLKRWSSVLAIAHSVEDSMLSQADTVQSCLNTDCKHIEHTGVKCCLSEAGPGKTGQEVMCSTDSKFQVDSRIESMVYGLTVIIADHCEWMHSCTCMQVHMSMCVCVCLHMHRLEVNAGCLSQLLSTFVFLSMCWFI